MFNWYLCTFFSWSVNRDRDYSIYFILFLHNFFFYVIFFIKIQNFACFFFFYYSLLYFILLIIFFANSRKTYSFISILFFFTFLYVSSVRFLFCEFILSTIFYILFSFYIFDKCECIRELTICRRVNKINYQNEIINIREKKYNYSIISTQKAKNESTRILYNYALKHTYS